MQGPHSAAGGVLLDVWAIWRESRAACSMYVLCYTCCALRCAAAIARIATTSLAHTSNVATLPPPDYFSLTSDPSYLPCSPCQPQPWRSATPASTWCPPTACSWASLAAASASTRPGPAPAPSAAWVRLWGAAGSRGVAQPSHSPTPSLGVREERLLAVAVKAPPPPPPPPASAMLKLRAAHARCSSLLALRWRLLWFPAAALGVHRRAREASLDAYRLGDVTESDGFRQWRGMVMAGQGRRFYREVSRRIVISDCVDSVDCGRAMCISARCSPGRLKGKVRTGVVRRRLFMHSTSAALAAHSPPSPCSARGAGPHLPLAGHLTRCAKPRLWRLRQAE